MAELGRVLAESFQLLIKEPRLFLPRLLSTLISSVWLLAFAAGELKYAHAVASLPVIGLMGVFVSVMVAAMVKHRDEDRLLQLSFKETLGNWKPVLAATGFFLFAGFVIAVPVSAGLYAYLTTMNPVPLAAGAAVSVLGLLLLSFASYFLPIGMYEEKDFLKGFRASAATSTGNALDVSALTLFSFTMLGVAAFAGSTLEVLGAAGFLAGRLVSAVVSTYIFVVSPSYYLD